VVKKLGATRHEKIANYDAIFVTCVFERGDLDIKFVFDPTDKVAGFFLVPSGQYRPPAYARPDAVVSREVTVGNGLLNLSGTLMLPSLATKQQPVPAVILVHGSGPHDRDETIGPNKPFLDLAYGLSARGIAVLRYEKRTKQHALSMVLIANSLTVREETIDDVVAAVEVLKHQAEIDSQRIFILGHSLGGMLLPRIAERIDAVAGFVGLAASARPMEDLILEQTEEILKGVQGLTPEESAEFEKLKAQVARVKSVDLSTKTPASDLPLGIPAAYWLDLRDYQPAIAAKAIKRPMLLLQGGRDYQVTVADLQLWRSAMVDRPNCTFREYPTLNHLFMSGTGRSVPAEYMREGHVDEQVIEDIANWLGKIKKPL
jgi:uncharacterized protein